MTPENIFAIVRRLDHIKEEIDEIKELAKETNGRVKELELWRARFQGAMVTTKIIWMVGGGVATAIAIDLLQRS